MFYVCVDFDGTMVHHQYPEIGYPVPGAINTIKWLQQNGAKIILWTMRSGEELGAAVKYCEDHDIELHGVNHNPDQEIWTSSPKAYAHYYIDDAAVGCPLLSVFQGRPIVNWREIKEYFESIL
jgi:hypothetical protein